MFIYRQKEKHPLGYMSVVMGVHINKKQKVRKDVGKKTIKQTKKIMFIGLLYIGNDT